MYVLLIIAMWYAVPSQGSVVVKYVLEMTKAAATSTVTHVRSAIVQNSGTFAGYIVDVKSIQASGMCNT